MSEQITTKPFVSSAQQRFAFGTGQPWAKRWADETDFSRLPERKRKERKWGKRRASKSTYPDQSQFAGYTMEDWDDTKPDSFYHDTRARREKTAEVCTCKGEQIAPGVTRIRGNLCNVHGRYGPCDAAAATPKPAVPKKRGSRSAQRRAARKPARTDEQKRAEQEAKRAQREQERESERLARRDETLSNLGMFEDAADSLKKLAAGQQVSDDGGLVKMGLAEVDSTGQLRLTANGRAVMNAAERGDAGVARDAMSRGRDAVARQQERERTRQTRTEERQRRQQEVAQRRAERESERKRRQAERRSSGGGGRSSDKKKPEEKKLPPPPKISVPRSQAPKGPPKVDQSKRTAARERREREARRAAERQQRDTQRQQERASASAERERRRQEREQSAAERRRVTTPELADASRRVADGEDIDVETELKLIRNGLVRRLRDGTLRLTETGLRAIRQKAQQTFGGTKRSDLPDSAFLDEANRSFPVKTAQDIRDAVSSWGRYKGPMSFEAFKKKLIARARAMGAMDAIPEKWTEKTARAFTVFKDASGQYRWITRTTTAYQDRDREIISQQALEDDAARMNETRQYGPLRWWHVGQPDPFDTTQPWGSGLDLGMCDYSTVIGRTSVESGTFKDAAIAEKVAATADQYEVSPGFFHAINQPDANGVFWQIRRFERSLVPTRYGRASNLFTGLTVKEHRMDPQEIERRLKAMEQALGLTPEQAAKLKTDIQQTDKAAETQGIAYKSDDTHQETIYLDPGGTAGVIRGGQWVALKAAAPPTPEPPIEEAKADEEVIEEEPAGDYIGDMSVADFKALLTETITALVAPALKMDEIMKSINGAVGELKSMYTTKDAGRAAEIAALKQQQDAAKAQLDAVDTRLKELEGDQPEVTPGRASQSPDTVITHDAALLAAAAKANGNGSAFAFDDILTNLGFQSQS